jgi:simple sugar transport system permease protein
VSRGATEVLLIRAAALAVSLILFGAFVAFAGADPFDVYFQMYRGSFGTAFSVQNTLLRAAPLMLTALCTAIPARLGLMVIGGEGALVIGGLASVGTGLAMASMPPIVVTATMAVVGFAVGGGWIALSGAMRAYRGVNETISSLLLNYIAIALLNHCVEGPMRDPTSLNKPSTRAIAPADMLQSIPGLDVHWGLVFGLVACVVAHVVMMRSVFGFGAAIAGGNLRAGLLCGLPVRRMMVIATALGGGAAGLAGMAEVAAVHGRANASLVTGYGYTGILVSFMARHEPLAIVPVALLFGGIGASNGLLQRMDNLPDASVAVLQGILFVVILASETLYGRFGFLAPKEERQPARPVTEAPAPEGAG